MPTAEFDPDQLERLMVAAFELLGKPEGQARELSRAILKAAERPQSDDPEPRARRKNRDPVSCAPRNWKIRAQVGCWKRRALCTTSRGGQPVVMSPRSANLC